MSGLACTILVLNCDAFTTVPPSNSRTKSVSGKTTVSLANLLVRRRDATLP